MDVGLEKKTGIEQCYFGEIRSQGPMNHTICSMKVKIMCGHSRHWFRNCSMSDHSLKITLDVDSRNSQ